jgi:hypothetical protein
LEKVDRPFLRQIRKQPGSRRGVDQLTAPLAFGSERIGYEERRVEAWTADPDSQAATADGYGN